MYITQKFVAEVNAIRQEFVGEMLYTEVIQKLDTILKKFRAKPVLFLDDRPKNDYSIGGQYEPSRKRRPISIDVCFSARYDKIKLSKKDWRGFIFVITQVVHHEHVHYCQNSHRGADSPIKYFILDDDADMTDEQKYFAEQDEIAAYAHDIAMEMVFHYPDIDPLVILRSLEKYPLESYKLYMESFAGTRWFDIRKELKKNIFKWLAYYTE